jgi:hypothetical protein
VELRRSEEAQTNDPETLTPLQCSEDSLKFLVPAAWKPGAYQFAIQCDAGNSAPVTLNAPDPWWQQGDWGREASPGGWLRIFGKCLSFDDHASVLLRSSGKDVRLKPKQQDCWSLNVELPGDLVAGEYSVFVHNGYGGQNGWRKVGNLRIAPHAPVWKTEVFDVTKYGATANDGMDATLAAQKALDAAEANGGGIVYFPRGRFQLNDPIRIPRHVLLKGAGMKLTQIYWRDTPEPFEALIYASNSFGIEDITIMAANHRYGILADDGGKPGAGNVTLRRIHIILNRFQQVQAELAVKRFLPMPWEHAICLGGENVQVTDCEVFSSRSPFGFRELRHSVVRNNRFFEGDVAHMFSGEAIILEDNEILGGPTGRGGADYGNKLYFARNKVGMTPLSDGEGFTTDGGGNTPVKLASCNGAHLTLAADVDWNRWTHNGECAARICIMDGTGAGQSRKVASYKGREVQLDEPWALPPDATSVLHLIPNLFRQNLIVGNQFHDMTLLQSYAWAFDWVISGNHFARAGGIRVFSHPGDPAWYMQCLDNEIDVGGCYRGPDERQPPGDSELAIVSAQARCQVLRRNVLHNNARISVNGSARDVLVEHNVICDNDLGIDAGRSQRTLLWGNRFERVKEPLVNVAETMFVNPADRMLNEFSAIGDSLPPGSEPTMARLGELAVKDPMSPGLTDEVRACVLQLLKQASASPQQDYPPEFLKAVLGVQLASFLPDNARPQLPMDGSGGKGNMWLSMTPAACAVPGRISIEFPATPGCRIEKLTNLELKPGRETGVNVNITVEPGVVGPVNVPLRWTVQGDGWKLGGHGSFKIGDAYSGKITQWAICGPFPNAVRNALDEDAVHGPERRLDLAAQYDTLAGKRGWTTLKTDKVDFTEQYGPQKSAVAYALVVLRAKKPTPVAIDFVVQPHNVFEPSLNGQPWRVPNHYGRQFSRTLKEGDNVLMVKLANMENTWSVEARLRMIDSAAPGDVEIVPIEKLASVAVLHPVPKPAIPEGKSLPFADGVDWKLAYEDDFDRNRLGTDWTFKPSFWAEGAFQFGNGVLAARTEMYSIISYAHKVTLPLRVEYDVKGKGGCVSTANLTRACDVGLNPQNCHTVGYAINCSRGGHHVYREGEKMADSAGDPRIEPDKWHHVVVQFVPSKISMFLDGKPMVEYSDAKWLSGLDTFSFIGDAWSLPQIDNVRIYTAGGAGQ